MESVYESVKYILWFKHATCYSKPKRAAAGPNDAVAVAVPVALPSLERKTGFSVSWNHETPSVGPDPNTAIQTHVVYIIVTLICPTMNIDVRDIGKFVALGGTFGTHQKEKDRTYRWPDLWVVPAEGVIPEGEAVEIPERVNNIKPGAEITAVIGDDIYEADEQTAWDAIKGFTISNDVTASGDWPGWSDPDHGMITGVGYKLLPTFSPILTEYVEKEDENKYDDLSVEVRVDGEVAVSGSTAQMSFSIPEMVSFASNICKLNENDVVALGDPGNPTKVLDSADTVTCEIEGIGELTNPIERV
jgi:2-keto-4-pentenoate hydratase/2-oxohepta-3-ene-1,7-dioic acid hydratase in catechol pathway